MTSKSEWRVLDLSIDPDTEERLFFTEHEWDTIEAAAARIIPTDHDPGAREARAIVFIDRYLSGIDYVLAAADGSGFLELSGPDADAARARNAVMRRLYRQGVRDLDALAAARGAADFAGADEQTQDTVLEELSGAPRPRKVRLDEHEIFFSRLQGNSDQDKPFFDTLCLHVRQGFYADPIYGGNKNRIGWAVIGFPGPESLKDTMDGTYSTAAYFADSWDWSELLRTYNPPSQATDSTEPNTR